MKLLFDENLSPRLVSALEPEYPGSAHVRTLGPLLDCWNRRNARDFATLFAADGNTIGFDGSPLNGRAEIESTLRQIFTDHPTAAYVGKIREVRFLTPDVAVLRAVAGMVPPGQSDLNPAANAVQTLVAARHEGQWRIAVFHNTPAAFHGRPELSEKLTEELRQALRASSRKVSMAPVFKSQTLSISIECPSRKVYEFISNPENLPKWAAGLCRSVRKSKGEWIVDTPQGPMKVRFVDKNALGWRIIT